MEQINQWWGVAHPNGKKNGIMPVEKLGDALLGINSVGNSCAEPKCRVETSLFSIGIDIY